MNAQRLWIVVVLPAALLLGFSVVAPQAAVIREVEAATLQPDGDAGVTSADPPGPTDPAELEAFLDGLVAMQMEENHIPGAAVAVVRNGEVLLAKGYGFADLENNIPVDPELTVFRIGSSGKLFTWTAVMQLVEQG